MSTTSCEAAADSYVAWWRGLPDTLGETQQIFAPQGRFVDPFSDISGNAAIERHLRKGYGKLHDVRITVTDRAYSGRVCYLRWSFVFRLSRQGREREIIGMSEIHFDDNGSVTLHFDHWDAASQVYEDIPILGGMLRTVKKRIGG